VLARRGTSEGRRLITGPLPDGLRIAAEFDDARVLAVTERPPALYTAAMTGFSPREYDRDRSWRWMSADAQWTLENTCARPILATVSLELSAFHHARRLEIRLDGLPVQTLVVEQARTLYTGGPLTVGPGEHALTFHASEPPTVAADAIGNDDRRALSFAFGAWTWTVRGDQP
jgi:hypothetical protein